jgi:hypothetical protein
MKSFKNFNLVCELSMFFYEIVFFSISQETKKQMKEIKVKNVEYEFI